MGNFVQEFWQRKFDLNFIKDFEVLPLTQEQQETILTNSSGYEQALLDAADYGIAHNGVKIYDNEFMRSCLDEFWSDDKISEDLRKAIGIEAFLVSGISEEMEANRLEEIEKAELAAKQAELDEQVEAEANRGGSTVIFAETLPDEIPTHELTNFTEDE